MKFVLNFVEKTCSAEIGQTWPKSAVASLPFRENFRHGSGRKRGLVGRRRREWKSIREVSSGASFTGQEPVSGLESLETSSVHPLWTPFPC